MTITNSVQCLLQVYFATGLIHHYLLLSRIDHVFCGGLAQVDNWNEQSDPKDVQGVLEKCAQLVPSIKVGEHFPHQIQSLKKNITVPYFIGDY